MAGTRRGAPDGLPVGSFDDLPVESLDDVPVALGSVGEPVDRAAAAAGAEPGEAVGFDPLAEPAPADLERRTFCGRPGRRS